MCVAVLGKHLWFCHTPHGEPAFWVWLTQLGNTTGLAYFRQAALKHEDYQESQISPQGIAQGPDEDGW